MTQMEHFPINACKLDVGTKNSQNAIRHEASTIRAPRMPNARSGTIQRQRKERTTVIEHQTLGYHAEKCMSVHMALSKEQWWCLQTGSPVLLLRK